MARGERNDRNERDDMDAMGAMVAALARHVGLPMPPERRSLIAADLERFEAVLARAGPPPLDADPGVDYRSRLRRAAAE